MILDSGERREFNSGAVRDMAEGKGRFDLTALDTVADVVIVPNEKGYVLRYLSNYIKSRDGWDFRMAIYTLCTEKGVTIYDAMMDYSKHCENGAAKYGEHNVDKGIPAHSFVDSAVRHYMKWMRGDNDEDHWVACLWNLMWLKWTLDYKPEFDDLKVS